ncbi:MULTISPECIES: Zn-ribbon domain-containing OB-fold protein [Nocardia]|uniref:Zn-ribbon domain-containing OB-fold protein n=1 Tax=Nocardia TaxID=1817 RepID=UPI001893C6AE|nr:MULTISPECIES: OB-fold domain-containing protein [Nocardia]MBF6347925.1 OB-fold domain-containing protein [Nocardia flavorosea]
MSEALRPRPPVNLDNAFFFDELKAGRISVQCCDSCAQLRHPPVPMCPQCHSLDWSARTMSGTGELISYVVMHHPVRPPFQDGYIVALVELAEGPRLVMNLEDIEEDDIEIGMKIRVDVRAVDAELILPVAIPAQ